MKLRLIIPIFISISTIFAMVSCEIVENNNSQETQSPTYTYKIVDTNVQNYYNDTAIISNPSIGQTFYGQDANYNDWRLPNAKELQSIIDYDRSPQTTSSPAINPIFSITEIIDPDGNPGQYPYFWTGISHLDGVNPYSGAVYIAFGEAQGKMNGMLMDVHGAGAQRSDPKSGDANDYPEFYGPQGDVRYVYNAVRCVRNIK